MSRARATWGLVAVLWVVAALNYLDRQVIFSVFPPLRAELKLSDVQLGLLGTAFLWVYAALSPVCGYLADRFGRARSITVSLFFWSAITWATGQTRTFSQLIAARASMGISEAFYLPAALAMISERYGERRSLATGIHTSGVYLGLVLGGAGGGWLAQHYGWRAPFSILGVFGVAYLAILVPAMRRAAPAAAREPVRFGGSIRELLRLPGYARMCAVFIATSMANWTLYTWLALYLYERFQMSVALAGAYTTYTYVAGAAGIVGGGWLADRWSSADTGGRLFTQTVGLALQAPALLLIAIAVSRPALIAGLIVFGIGKGLYDCNVMPVLAQVARPALRSTGYGIFNMLGCLAGGLMAPLAGWMKSSIGMAGAFEFASAVLFLSTFLMFRLRLPRGPMVFDYEPISNRG
jgi:MFS transporter, Spinster family, sphingosine-1-phosphate transporter